MRPEPPHPSSGRLPAGRGTGLLPVAVIAAALCTLSTRAAEAAPDTSLESSDRARVHMAGARSDTLAHGWRTVLPVAIAELEHSEWTIERADTARRRIVTEWKPLKHFLARVFLGRVLARCVVDLEPLGGGRTRVTIRGGLASEGDLERNPGFAAAQQTYDRAAVTWLERVRTRLDAQSSRTSDGRDQSTSTTRARSEEPGTLSRRK